jgi:hypothetical protein
VEALVTNVNWLAVGLSTIISYLFASFWYSPTAFGGKWAAGLGLKDGAQGGFSMIALVCQFFSTLLLAWIISLAVANDSVAFIFLISLTIFFFVLTANLMSKASNYSSLVEATFVLTMSFIMTACNFLL